MDAAKFIRAPNNHCSPFLSRNPNSSQKNKLFCVLNSKNITFVIFSDIFSRKTSYVQRKSNFNTKTIIL